MLDEVGPRPAHDVLVAAQRLLERRRVVRLEPLDGGLEVRVRVQLARGGATALGVGAQLLPADLEDRVSVEVAEATELHELAVALAAQRPVVGRARERGVQPVGVVVERRTARRRSRCPAGRGRPGVSAVSAGLAATISTKSPGRSCGVADLQLLPDRDRGARRSRTGAGRQSGTAAMRSAMRSSRSESGARHARTARKTASPMSSAAGPRRSQRRTSSRRTAPEADAEQVHVALEARRGGGGRRGRAPRRRRGGLVARDLVLDRRRATGVAQAVVLGVDAEVGRRDRVVGHQPPDTRLHEVVEAAVGRALVGRGCGSREVHAAELVGHRSSAPPLRVGAPWLSRCGPVRRRRSRPQWRSGLSRAGPRRPRPPPCRRHRPSPRSA